MRRIVVSLSVLLVLSAFPVVSSQHAGHGGISSEDNTVNVPDGPSDVQVLVAPKQGVPAQNGSQQGTNFDHIDITSLLFADETEKDFKIHLHLKSLEQTTPTGAGFPFWVVQFAYGKINWRVTWSQCQGGSARDPTKGCLQYGGQGTGSQRAVKEIAAERNTQMKAVVFTIPKNYLFNENRVPAQFGTELTNIYASTSHFFAGAFFVPGGDPTGGVTANDRAPNTGVSGKAFKLLKGSNSNGHIALIAPIPIRVSNGEATTIVYKLQLYNHHNEPLTVTLEARDIPEEWLVRAPALIKMEPSSTKTFPVILAMPFTHDHGKTATFALHAQALEDKNSWAHQDLGVYWTEIPQPSGHHEGETGGTFFHSAKIQNDRIHDSLEGALPTFQYWMNGIQVDPDVAAKDENVPSQFNEYFFCLFASSPPNCAAPPTFVASWFFPLSPELLLGLDFEMGKKGSLDVEILPKVTATTAGVEAKLLFCDPAQTNRICPLNQTSQGAAACPSAYSVTLASGKTGGALAANAISKFHIDMDVNGAADFIVYRPGINMGLCLQLKTDTPQNMFGTDPRPEFVTKAGRFHLPLIEYHDPVDQAFENVGTLGLVTKADFEKRVNPGRTAVWEFDLLSNATGELDVQLAVEGINAEWARIIGPTQVRAKPSSVMPFMVAVTVPPDVNAAERADLSVVAQSVADASVVAVTTIRATVVTDEQIPDEASKIQGGSSGGDSPGFGVLLVAAAVGLVGAFRRRRV